MVIDWTNEDWAYFLGVVHGDGTVGPRSVSVCVGHKEKEYQRIITRLMRKIGLDPKEYGRSRSAVTIAAHRKWLAEEFAKLKHKGKWSWPSNIAVGPYISGVIDTDGCVTKLPTRGVIVTLKRSGNLYRLADWLTAAGLHGVHVLNGKTKYCGRPYEIETLAIRSMEGLLRLGEIVSLRHPRKRDRFAKILTDIRQRQAVVPLWERVGRWIEKEPSTWEEIASKFDITKAQVDSALQNLKNYSDVEVIPPPKALTRYSARNLSSFRGGRYAK